MKLDVRLDHLSDDALLQGLGALITKRNELNVKLLAYLAEVDRRKLYLGEACSTLFDFCVKRLGLAEGAAAKRIWAARTARRFPVIFEMLGRGEIHLTGIHLLARHLTEENHRALLGRARYKTKREMEKLIAEIAPRPDVASRIRALPQSTSGPCKATAKAHAPATAPAAAPAASDSGGMSLPISPAELAPAADAPLKRDALAAPADERPRFASRPEDPNVQEAKSRRGSVAPLSARRYEIRITVDEDTHAALAQLQDLLGHQVPNGDPAAIISRALDSLLEKTLARKAGLTDRPGKAAAPKKRTRQAPAWIRRAVWKRDGGRCTYQDPRGRRCAARRYLEYHHIENWAEGGEHSVDNLTLRCRGHNQHQAELDYGEAFMKAAREGAWRSREPGASYLPPWPAQAKRGCTRPKIAGGAEILGPSGVGDRA